MNKKGILIVVSGFSGAGKGTLMKELMRKYPENYALSISATTRGPRDGEVDGRERNVAQKTCTGTLVQTNNTQMLHNPNGRATWYTAVLGLFTLHLETNLDDLQWVGENLINLKFSFFFFLSLKQSQNVPLANHRQHHQQSSLART